MGRHPGFEYTRYPTPDAMENLGATCHTASLQHARQREWGLAVAYKRMAKMYWALAQTIREEQQRSALPAANEKSA